MEPFVIQCPTCGSSIRIKNAGLIGQIANCPKCQSLLQIAPPSQDDASNQGEFAADSSALTRESIPASVEERPPVDDQDDYRLAPETSPPAAASSEGDAFEESVSSWQPAEAPLVPTEDWTSQSSNRTKQYLLVGVLGFTGLLLAVGGFFAFLSWYNKPAQKPDVAEASNATDTQATDNAPQNAAEAGTDPGTDASTDSDGQAVGQQDPLDPESAAASDLDSSQSNGSIQTDLPVLGTNEPINGDAAEDDPANFAAAGADDNTDSGSDASDDAAAEEAALGAGNAEFERLSSILDVRINPQIPDESVLPTEPPVTAEELGLRSSITRPPLQPIDIATQLEATLGGIVLTTKSIPLNQWLNTWTHLSGVPTTIDFELFAAAGLETNQAIALPRVQNVTLGEYLKAFADALKLVPVPMNDSHVILRPTPEAIQSNLPQTLPLAGVVDEADQSWLMTVLETWFPDAAGKLSINDGELSFDDRETDVTTWIEIARLVRSLRAAKLGTATGDLLATRFLREPEVAGLAKETSIVSGQSRPVGQVLSRVGRQAGLDVWIDWASVREIGLGPSETEAVVTHGRPAARVLTDYAILFHLEIAIINEQTIWLTSTEAYRSQVQSYVLPADGKTVEQWQSELRELTPKANDASEVGRVLVELSPDGQFALIRSCRPRLRIIK